MVSFASLIPRRSLLRFDLLLSLGLTLFLAACMPVQAPAPAAAAPTNTPVAAAAMTTTQTMTATGTTSSTAAMTATSNMSSTMPMTATASSAGATVMIFESPTLGKILTDAKGMTLYIFDKDVQGKSNCAGGCLKNWPAFTVQDEDAKVTGDGVTATFGVIDRGDGTYQVTANGMPLYYYVKDPNPHDATGQAVGDVWWVVGPDGNKITKQ